MLFRSCFPHDLASAQRLTLARWFSGCAIRQEIVGGKYPGMRNVRVQSENQCGPVLDDSDPGVAMTVNSPLVALGQAEPPLEIKIVLDLFELPLTHKKAGQEADHQRGHVLANRILIPLESVDQLLELRPAIPATSASRVEGRGHLVDVLDILAD